MAKYNELIIAAKDNLKNSYSPYSHFAVSAALLTDSGKVYKGINIENASYPAGICAERAAFSSALSHGERNFSAIAIVCEKNDFCYPCGICRQFMAEFCNDDFEIVLSSGDDIRVVTLGELLPESFDKEVFHNENG